MGIILGIILGAILWVVVCAIFGSTEESASSTSETSELILNARKTKFTPEGSSESIDAFEVQFKGNLVAPQDNTEVEFTLRLRDCTGGKRV